ncbi:MAG TPA: zinc-binding dehydrogenase, partial [Candidatus Sulfotelmatobacter sp.]|nr:zinc-binding dehydrogenase [Candidatus Sulfotelmatobacter sp.]
DEMSYEDGTFIEPLACVARAQRLAGLKPGQSVLVLGSGISGLLHILLARALGAGKIMATDINDYRLKTARRLGAQDNDNRPVDLAIVCTGALPAFTQALKSVDRGGTVLFFACTEPGVALPLPVNDIWRNGIKLLPSYGAGPYDLTVALELIRAGRVPVKDLITHRLSLAEIAQGFKLVAEAKESLKVIINP